MALRASGCVLKRRRSRARAPTEPFRALQPTLHVTLAQQRPREFTVARCVLHNQPFGVQERAEGDCFETEEGVHRSL